MYAILQTGGKQYQVSPGDVLEVEKLPYPTGETIELDHVLLVRDGENLHVGRPKLDNARVKATVLDHDRGKKIVVFKMKRRKNYRRKQGHRQDFTRIRVEEIVTA